MYLKFQVVIYPLAHALQIQEVHCRFHSSTKTSAPSMAVDCPVPLA